MNFLKGNPRSFVNEVIFTALVAVFWVIFVALAVTPVTGIGFIVAFVPAALLWHAFTGDEMPSSWSKNFMTWAMVATIAEFIAFHSLARDYSISIPYFGIGMLVMIVETIYVFATHHRERFPIVGYARQSIANKRTTIAARRVQIAQERAAAAAEKATQEAQKVQEAPVELPAAPEKEEAPVQQPVKSDEPIQKERPKNKKLPEAVFVALGKLGNILEKKTDPDTRFKIFEIIKNQLQEVDEEKLYELIPSLPDALNKDESLRLKDAVFAKATEMGLLQPA